MMNEALRSKDHLSRNVMIALLVLFTALAAARLNQLYLFAPDSADYVVMARGLVNDQEYREVQTPGEPYFTLRPPGMSLLLVPAALIAPYDVVFAKITVIVTAIIMLALLYTLMCRLENSAIEETSTPIRGHHWFALFILLLFATNPYVILFSTMVMSEIPFTAITLAILFLLAKDEEKITKRKLLLLTCLLSFLPFLRTIGVALVLAVGLWAVAKRTRWPYLISVVCSIAATALWMLRNSAYKSQSYTSIAIDEMKKAGVVGTLFNMFNRSVNHIESICQKIFPNMPGEIPVYENLILQNNLVLPGPQLAYRILGIGIIVIAIFGMIKCWKRGGAVSLLYLGITLAILSIWPWMQRRFTLPLLPVILAFLPVGMIFIFKYFAGGNALSKKIVSGILIIAGVAVFIAQSRIDYGIIDANRLLLSQGDDFYQTELPSGHFSNFVEAGNWINEHTPQDARVLTCRNEVVTSSHRFQRMVHFSNAKPKSLHRNIQSFSPRYLVCYGRDVVGAFPWHLLDNDLVYRLTPIYEKAGVMIIEVQPNYEGTVRHQYWREDESMEIARNAYDQFPYRRSTQLAYLEQLLAAEEYVAAISFAKELQTKGINEVRIVNLLGWAYLGNLQYQQAIQEFVKALHMPGQKTILQSIHRGGSLAQKKWKEKNKANEKDQPTTKRNHLMMAENLYQLRDFNKAQKSIRKVLDSDESSNADIGKAHLLLAKLQLANGQKQQAIKELDLSREAGNQEAKTLIEMLNLEKTTLTFLKNSSKQDRESSQTLDETQRESILKLAAFYEAEGVPGKSLKLLMQAHAVAPSDLPILKLLAKYQLFYNILPEAEANYRTLEKAMPDDQVIKAALAKIQELKKVPRF